MHTIRAARLGANLRYQVVAWRRSKSEANRSGQLDKVGNWACTKLGLAPNKKVLHNGSGARAIGWIAHMREKSKRSRQIGATRCERLLRRNEVRKEKPHNDWEKALTRCEAALANGLHVRENLREQKAPPGTFDRMRN